MLLTRSRGLFLLGTVLGSALVTVLVMLLHGVGVPLSLRGGGSCLLRSGRKVEHGWFSENAGSEGNPMPAALCNECWCMHGRLTCTVVHCARKIALQRPHVALAEPSSRPAGASASTHPPKLSTPAVLPEAAPPPRHVSLRVLCLVPVGWPPSDAVRVIRETWGPHCDKLLFTSTEADAELGIVALPEIAKATERRDLWNIVHPAWTYVAAHHLEEYDYFVKADDDSFVVVENLRFLVRDLNPDDTHYLGHTSYHTQPSFNNGCGYVLSRGALRRVAPWLPSAHGWDREKSVAAGCNDGVAWAEDLKMGGCMRAAGIKPDPMHDSLQRQHFLTFKVKDHLEMVRRKDSKGWYWKNQPRSVRGGLECCSARPVLFHGFKHKDGSHTHMYMLHAVLYSFAVAERPRHGDSEDPDLATIFSSSALSTDSN